MECRLLYVHAFGLEASDPQFLCRSLIIIKTVDAGRSRPELTGLSHRLINLLFWLVLLSQNHYCRAGKFGAAAELQVVHLLLLEIN